MKIDRGNIDSVQFDANGLVPAVVQDVRTREVLMLAYMNRESLALSLDRGETYFYSRSRKAIWHKGETSGNLQKVEGIHGDCDVDTLLVEVMPSGPACHRGTYSCFEVDPGSGIGALLDELYSLIVERRDRRPEGSYTTYLFESGIDKILKKVGEEAAETIIAAKNASSPELVGETSDLVYHLLVMLVDRGVGLDAIRAELEERHASRPGRS